MAFCRHVNQCKGIFFQNAQIFIFGFILDDWIKVKNRTMLLLSTLNWNLGHIRCNHTDVCQIWLNQLWHHPKFRIHHLQGGTPQHCWERVNYISKKFKMRKFSELWDLDQVNDHLNTKKIFFLWKEHDLLIILRPRFFFCLPSKSCLNF